MGDPSKAGLEALKPVAEQYENSIYNLKKSILKIEQFDRHFEDLAANSKAGENAANKAAEQEVPL